MQNVKFLGGEYDGQVVCLPYLPERYLVPHMRRRVHFGKADAPDFIVDTKPDLSYTEYVHIKRYGAHFYVERELLRLANDNAMKNNLNPLEADMIQAVSE